MSKVGLFFTASVFVAACGGAAPKVEGAAAAATSSNKKSASCERRQPGVGAVRADTVRQGSTVVLARVGNETLAYVADEDGHAIRTVDVDRGVPVANTPL